MKICFVPAATFQINDISLGEVMNKKIPGVRISSILTMLLCILAAFVVWVCFNVQNEMDLASILSVSDLTEWCC